MLGAALYTPGAPSLYTRSTPNICQAVEFCLRLQYNYVEISLHGVTMMATRAGIRAGDLVRIVDREATPQDQKVGLFYNHYRCLPGQVRKIYGGEQAAVKIEADSLPEDIRARHASTRDQMRERWLEGLTDDARRRVKAEQKQFELSYVILVGVQDLE